MSSQKQILGAINIDDIEQILSSVVAEFEKSDITILRRENNIIIAAKPDHIAHIRDRITSVPELEKLAIINISETLPDVKLAKEINPAVLEFVIPDVEKIPDLISCIMPHYSRKFASENKFKNIQGKLFAGYTRARFNQQRQLQKQIRTKHK